MKNVTLMSSLSIRRAPIPLVLLSKQTFVATRRAT